MPGNPWDIPEWHFIGRETALVRQLLGSGITALGQANYADLKGEYYTAFFGISIGLERLAKLILVADHAITHNGSLPPQSVVRKYGHAIDKLLDAAETIKSNHKLKGQHTRPTNMISREIIDCIVSFSDANRGRYANFAALGDPNLGRDEPIRRWWERVAALIIEKHYIGKPAQHRIEANARIIHEMMAPHSMVLHISETGELMDDVFTSSIRTGQNKIVQKYGRYYALQIVRCLSEIYYIITQHATYQYHIDAFFGAWEHVQTFVVDDAFLLTRKKWPLA